jgi:hypothetical protein
MYTLKTWPTCNTEDMFQVKLHESLVPTQPAVSFPAPASKKKKDKNMSRRYDEDTDCYYDTLPAQTAEQQAKDRLILRANDLQWPATDKLAREFGMADDDAPTTFKDFLERIKKGKYVMSDKIKEDQKLWHPEQYIRWRDPAVKEDQAGYEAALEKFNKQMRDTIDEIYVLTPEEGLKALRKLEQFKA